MFTGIDDGSRAVSKEVVQGINKDKSRVPGGGYGLFRRVRPRALELAPTRVNVVSPGWVDTQMWNGVVGEAKSGFFDDMAGRLPAGRVATSTNIALHQVGRCRLARYSAPWSRQQMRDAAMATAFSSGARHSDIASAGKAQNPRDRVAGFRVMQLLPGVGRSSAQSVLDAIADNPDPIVHLAALPCPQRAAADWPDFVGLLDNLRNRRSGFSRMASRHQAIAISMLRAPALSHNHCCRSSSVGHGHSLCQSRAREAPPGRFGSTWAQEYVGCGDNEPHLGCSQETLAWLLDRL
ncbi:Enoyl-(Acyl carrier protein) reductase [Mesorhizobium sp. YR577]|nr:Enoyl-(Acyl carrier protein) reductase [Mesorhizobium sp. YR577]